VTVEGLTDNAVQCGNLNGVQQAMIDCHGSQCGFCTPGFVMTMTGILEDKQQPTENDWRRGLTGNLCRCTGYTPIIDAGLQSDAQSTPAMNECFEPAAMLETIGDATGEEIKVTSDSQTIYSPTTIDQAVEFLGQHPEARVVAGATDVGVQFNKGYCEETVWLDLNRVASLKTASNTGGAIVAGSGATWSNIETLIEQDLPQFHQILTWFGSPQIRNVGTIGGNIINASPIADSLPLMFVSDAELQLRDKNGTREVNINDFYQGYKKFDLKPGELLSQVRIPLPEEDEELRLYKISRRQDMDISTFTAAIKMKLSGSTIQSAAIAYGAVGPVVLRLPKTESFLAGKELDQETMTAAGEIAVSEITPITDVRGGDEYRFQLARSVLLKFLHEVRPEGVLA
jgi:xanthine dehydrogenase small subunit